MNKHKIGLVLALIFVSGLSWLAFQMAKPILLGYESVDSVRFDFFGIPIVGTYALLGIMLFATINIAKSLYMGQQTMRPPKEVLIVALIFALIGFGVNYSNYYFVIKPNAMAKCPPKVGYKKNLLSDYVKHLNLCEKL